MEHADCQRHSTMGSSLGTGSCSQVPEPTHVGDIMQYGVITITPETSGYEAIRLLVERDISGLPVVDDIGLVGMISEKDILRMVVEAQSIPATVSEFMTTEIVTCEEDAGISEVCTSLAGNAFRHIPVVRGDKLVGLVSRSDLIRAHKDRFRPATKTSDPCPDLRRPVARDVMTCGLLTVTPETPLYQAMQMLASHDITGLPVVDDALYLVGILSEKDIIEVLCNPQPAPQSIGALMTTDVVSFGEEDSLMDLCDCLATNGFRRVPILRHGRLIGIVSRRDLIVFLLKNRSFVQGHRAHTT